MISRASVFNILNQAEVMGLTLHAVRGRGYRLAQPVDWLDAAEVSLRMGKAARFYRIEILDSVDSSNAALMALALEGAPDGTVLCAENQFSGKGRRGRPWQAVLGGSLTFSLLLRFETGLQSLSGLSLVIGLAVARAVQRHTRHPVRLKWPNDVLVDYRKLAGILVEVQGDLHGAAFAVVGIGLNVRMNDAQRESIDQAVVDLAEMGVMIGRNQLLGDCLLELHMLLQIFRDKGFGALRSDWMERDAYAGRNVTLHFPASAPVHGVACGVDDTGAFLLNDKQGTQAFSGGEISLRLGAGR